jgi:hypothetical protein
MKPGSLFLAGIAAYIAFHPAALSQSESRSFRDNLAAASPDDIRAELKKLLLADSVRNAGSAPFKAPTVASGQGAPDALVMSPYVVKESRIPQLRGSVYEPPILRFLRDGTLFENVGRTFTTRLRLRFYSTDSPTDHSPGDESTLGDSMPAMLGNLRPRNGAQLGLSWSW